jgi:spermidine dehydrogenase
MTDEVRHGDGITRRDFLDGVAITAAGLAAAAAAPLLTGSEAAAVAARGGRPIAVAPLPPGYDPDIVAGIKGTPDELVELHHLVDGVPNPDDVHSTRGGRGVRPRRARDTGEVYDCVIVGAGASGVAAAKFYKDRFGAGSKILVLDAMDDVGGTRPATGSSWTALPAT